jgi:hypothetical protein
MSHTSEITAIVFTDVGALQAAATELNQKGVSCALIQNAVPRAYFQNQVGLEQAPYVLRLNNCVYDVGFYSNGKGGYVARTDLWGGSIAGQLGVPTTGTESREQAALGKLYQAYAVNAAIRQAAKQGYRTQRSVRPDGTIQLTMTV